MIEDGLYTRFPKPDYALAFHVAAEMPAGRIEVPPTIVASSADSVTILVHGVGTHGAYPHLGIDPVLVAAQIVVSLQSMVGRDINPLAGRGDQRRLDPRRREEQHHPRAGRAAAHRARRQSRGAHALLDGIDRVARGTALALGVPRGPAAGRHPLGDRDDAADDQRCRRPRARVRDAIAAAMGRDAADRRGRATAWAPRISLIS